MPDVDTGNPGSWWRTYKGKYEVTPGEGVTLSEPNVMLATVNDVQFMCLASIAEYTMYDAILTLPDGVKPITDVYIPCAITHDAGTEVVPLHIEPNGIVSLEESYTNLEVHLAGVTFNIGMNWYSNTGGGESNE